jgi:DNA-binding transcriptional regulator GbsR (MarR family)
MIKPPIDPFLDRFIALAGDVAEMVSLNRSLGQLYGFLYIAIEPTSLEEIAASCKMSKGNASIYLRILGDWNAAHRASKPGTRKDYYVANRDIRNIIAQRLREGLSKRTSVIRQRFREMESDPAVLARLNQPENVSWKKRIREAETLMSRAEKTLPFLLRLIGSSDGR